MPSLVMGGTRYPIKNWTASSGVWTAVVIVLASLSLAATALGLSTAAAAPTGSSGSLSRFDSPYENRVDLSGSGRYDTYWQMIVAGWSCTLSLFDLVTDRKKWEVKIDDCAGVPKPPVFYRQSFMGDAKRDFSIVIARHDGRFSLLAGDGSSGALRDFSFELGNASRPSIMRINGTAVVDFKLAKYPGPALFVRSTGGGGDQRGHLFYFPSGSNGYVDISEDPETINKQAFGGYPFPGVDVPVLLQDVDLYTRIYDAFNTEPCARIKRTEAPGECGVPDGDKPTSGTWERGNGYFLDKVAVGDIDNDGVDDLLLTYLWRSAVYPGRPNGKVQALGAPQYDNYYNPQGDSLGCHSGRHYGLTALVKTGGSRYLSSVDVAGVPVGQFSDPLQNVSRNVALVRTERRGGSSNLSRVLAWNVPLGTSIPGCASASLYDSAIHYPADGLIRDAAGTPMYVQVNRWTNASSGASSCSLNDLDCYSLEQKTRPGHWSWEVRKIADGAAVKSIETMYVWDFLPIRSSIDLWVLYSARASEWDLSGNRTDLTVARLDISTMQFADQQRIPIAARPFMKTQHWQSLDKSVSSNWPATRLFVLPGEDAPSPSFVLQTSTGSRVYSYVGRHWAETAAP